MIKGTRITEVENNSPAYLAGICAGDYLLNINGEEVKDIFDFHFLVEDESVNEYTIRKADGSEEKIDIKGVSSQELGLVFENGLMDDYKSCYNNCIFCFIDQMPKGMRDTLYFKDDDARLSFLNGNYITMTNMSYSDIDRIIHYHLSPMNISIHTTDPGLRSKMLNNKHAGDILEKIKKLYDAGIEMNGQIVLCKGLNDGIQLTKTIRDLFEFEPVFKSLSVVPVGLTKYREGLYKLESFNKEDSINLLNQIRNLQEEFRNKSGSRFVFPSDEWYLNAELDIPEEDYYEEYPQLENGVGMLRSFINTVDFELNNTHKRLCIHRSVSVATGALAYNTIYEIAQKVMKKINGLTINVYKISNDYFGEKITVSGLLCGQDIIKQLQNKELGSKLLLSSDMFKAGEEVLIDDMTVSDLSDSLKVPIEITRSDGKGFCKALISKKPLKQRGTANYE